jgi:hypothetical protein
MKRPIGKYYSQGNVFTQEPHWDKVIAEFCKQLEDRFTTGSGDKICDLGQWIAFCKYIPATAQYSIHDAEQMV